MVKLPRGARAAAVALAALGCQTLVPSKVLSVPPEMLREKSGPSRVPEAIVPRTSAGPATPKPATPESKYLVRLAEGGRVWEVELPESAGGYEVRVPLSGGPVEQQTLADEELLADGAAQASGTQPGMDAASPQLNPKASAKKHSYLGVVAKVNEMYTARKYELALIELVSLEKEYPQDARLLSMKGSLYLRLGKPKLARETWEKALSINPDDHFLAEALRELASREE